MRLATSGKRNRRVGLFGAISLFAGILPGFVLASASPASAFTGSSFVSFTLEGCRNDGTIRLPNTAGKFVCPEAAYTTGNLGKGWNELDLVPHRLTTDLGNQAGATTDYSAYIAADYQTNGKTGYDVISVPVINTAKSDASCAVSAGADLTAGSTASPFGGGTDVVRYRELSIHQDKGTTCVFDWYERLALGAHLYSGSSLQSYLADQEGLSGSKKTVSIPVNQIEPQSISKDMAASQGSDHIWDVVKNPTPATLSFANTCDGAAARSQGFAVTVRWTKQAATPTGPITVITHVYATNPAARAITIDISDSIRSGTTQVDSATGTTIVAANSTVLVLTRQTTVPAGTAGLNDVATGTYSDPVTLAPVPGSTTATASATPTNTGPELNGSAVINDVTWLTGSNLSYSLDSTSGASGAFDDGYVVGTPTTSPVSWTSDSQSGSGSVTLNGTAYVTSATVTSGAIHDVAGLAGSDGFTTSASADVAVSSSATTSLGVSKTTSLKLSAAQTFTFHLYTGSNTSTGDTATVAMPALSNGPVASTTISGLSPTGTYYFQEDGSAPYSPQKTASKTFNLTPGDLSTCSGSIPVNNGAAPARAQVRKSTVPTSSGLWTFTLTGPGGLNETLSNVQANAASYSLFATPLDSDGGTYTITETPQAGYDLTNVAGDLNGNAGRVSTSSTGLTCSFTLNLTTDSAGTFECAFTNTQRGHIIVKKTTRPAGSTQSFGFTPSYGSGFSLTDGQSKDSGLLVPGSYSVAEAATSGWDLTSATCDNGDSPGAITLAPGATVTCTFTNTQRGAIVVKKLTAPTGGSGSFAFTGDAAGTIGDGGTIVVSDLQPGTYSSAEADPRPAYDLTGISCDDGASATASTVTLSSRNATFKLDPGETVTCTFTNTARGHAKVVKTVNGAVPSGAQAFVFQLRSGASATSAGTTLESGTANANDGGVIAYSTYLVPGQTYQMCEQMMPGWLTTLGPPLFTAYNPSGDNSVVCTDFTVAAGATKVFSIDNTPPPGGRALTIGFWKNWASCAGSAGKQKPMLDQTLLAAAQAGQPVTIGTLVLDPAVLGASTACKDAVNLLNKTTLTGTKKASDPLFNMAAQLVAAKLDVAAGAGACANAVSAISSAQALLVKYHFDGYGYAPKLTAGDTTLANNVATTLDKYNNNKLC